MIQHLNVLPLLRHSRCNRETSVYPGYNNASWIKICPRHPTQLDANYVDMKNKSNSISRDTFNGYHRFVNNTEIPVINLSWNKMRLSCVMRSRIVFQTQICIINPLRHQALVLEEN